jgi:carbon storage regulator CsrA
MLVLSRQCESEICIGSDITIKVLKIHKRQVKLGIDAPSGFSIWREELSPAADCSQLSVEPRFSRSQQSCLAKPLQRRS